MNLVNTLLECGGREKQENRRNKINVFKWLRCRIDGFCGIEAQLLLLPILLLILLPVAT